MTGPLGTNHPMNGLVVQEALMADLKRHVNQWMEEDSECTHTHTPKVSKSPHNAMSNENKELNNAHLPDVTAASVVLGTAPPQPRVLAAAAMSGTSKMSGSHFDSVFGDFNNSVCPPSQGQNKSKDLGMSYSDVCVCIYVRVGVCAYLSVFVCVCARKKSHIYVFNSTRRLWFV